MNLCNCYTYRPDLDCFNLARLHFDVSSKNFEPKERDCRQM